ncbi:MAG: CbiX/SirB N-terminal domain-containing protein [Candidatus Parcubacteria bacterium]|nr:CbiX/SirB N-terminal domain-containing protein [Burkholderiales bacterium]
MARRALVLFAHGSRDPQWARPFQQLVIELGELLPGERIVLAFLELMQPSLSECAASLHAEGLQSIRIVPVFLGMGGHLKEDLPKLVARIRGEFPDLQVTVDPPIGEQPEVILAIAKAIAR